MPRAKGGPKTRRRHKKILKLTKGHKGARANHYRKAHESMLSALSYAFRDRRDRKGVFRRLWIVRINAAVRQLGFTYGPFMAGLKRAGIDIDRKNLAEMAVNDPTSMARLVELARGTAQ